MASSVLQGRTDWFRPSHRKEVPYRPGRIVEVRRLIDDDRWISWPGDDGAFGAAQGRASYSGAAGDTQHAHVAMIEDGLGAFQRWFLDDRDEVVDANHLLDRLIE